MTRGQAYGFLSDPEDFVFFCNCILVFVAIKVKFKPYYDIKMFGPTINRIATINNDMIIGPINPKSVTFDL